MLRYNIILLLACTAALSFGQEGSDQIEEALTVVEVMPEFPGGPEAMFQFIADNVTYPPEALTEGISGTVYLIFVVEKDGTIEHAKVARGIDPRCDSVALNAVLKMPPWSPGMVDGDSVRVKYNLPVKFMQEAPVKEK